MNKTITNQKTTQNGPGNQPGPILVTAILLWHIQRYKMTWFEQIKAARIKKGLTQQEVADISGITERNYQRIEAGTTWPRLPVMVAICKALRIKSINIV